MNVAIRLFLISYQWSVVSMWPSCTISLAPFPRYYSLRRTLLVTLSISNLVMTVKIVAFAKYNGNIRKIQTAKLIEQLILLFDKLHSLKRFVSTTVATSHN